MLRRTRTQRLRRIGVSVRGHKKTLREGVNIRPRLLLPGRRAPPRLRPERAVARHDVLQIVASGRRPRALLGWRRASGGGILRRPIGATACLSIGNTERYDSVRRE